MSSYIALYRYTDQGIRNVKESPNRVAAFRQHMQSMGAELKANYLTMGEYDLVSVFEAPDDETVAKLTLALGALGNVRTETLRAFTEEEFGQLVTSLP